jgi:hypothetical protein
MARFITTRSGKVINLDRVRDGHIGKQGERRANALDLSHDTSLASLLTRRASLKDTEQAGKDAEAERKTIDETIIAKLGNAEAALAPDGSLVTALSVSRKECTIPAATYRYVRIERP